MQRDHPAAMIEIAEKTGDIIDVLQVIEKNAFHLAHGMQTVALMFCLCANGGQAGAFLLATQVLKRLLSYWMFHIQKCC